MAFSFGGAKCAKSLCHWPLKLDTISSFMIISLELSAESIDLLKSVNNDEEIKTKVALQTLHIYLHIYNSVNYDQLCVL